jgi:hypothetical protein
MTSIYERQLWCSDCRRNHVIKLYSKGELDERDQARLFPDGDYADQLRKHSVCGNCGSNMPPHTDLDIVVTDGEWKEICLECFRKG